MICTVYNMYSDGGGGVICTVIGGNVCTVIGGNVYSDRG